MLAVPRSPDRGSGSPMERERWRRPPPPEAEDKKAYLRYALRDGGRVMDIVHTFVPPSKRGTGLGLPPLRLRIPTRQDQLHVRCPYLLLRLGVSQRDQNNYKSDPKSYRPN
ncbi:hypothetical protein ACJRO7_032417 [Eucalyptus globulus]|uniref:Uncharacterized protein n=1 Tax=Eucalyptus globulus TaxID=34317 RepID=A0ABD3JTM2_EUCGL